MATATKKDAPAKEATKGETKGKAKTVKADLSPEAKTARFKKVAGGRTKNALQAIYLLGNCANTNVYTYTEEQLETIFSALEKQLKETRAKFAPKVVAPKANFSL